MKAFCGKKEKFLSKTEINKFNCNAKRIASYALCKKPMKGITKFRPCAYFIMRK